jgi:hypothetical protein
MHALAGMLSTRATSRSLTHSLYSVIAFHRQRVTRLVEAWAAAPVPLSLAAPSQSFGDSRSAAADAGEFCRCSNKLSSVVDRSFIVSDFTCALGEVLHAARTFASCGVWLRTG